MSKIDLHIHSNISIDGEHSPEKIVKATGIPVAEEEIMAASVNGIVTGEQIAERVLEREDTGEYEILRPYLAGGEKSDMPNVNIYWDFFAEGKPAYVPIQYLQMRDAVKLIHDTGGIAVLAHPGQNLAKDDILYDIINEKIDGIKVFSSYHSERDVRILSGSCGEEPPARHLRQ